MDKNEKKLKQETQQHNDAEKLKTIDEAEAEIKSAEAAVISGGAARSFFRAVVSNKEWQE
ncbi:hypothetical protein [Nostoc sphaeroides]|uniref:Uncharacterized protein n=1 Tax=Nostoc sphaeroides CCNUC1 TaxID=2653204 RepID=A0A5P8WJS6_9NOSO|nr:hypothetical protein [Nostoc sphaeroides]QFS52821.1 hypothetical protein GXM_10085 [Nostoc sphaeroides CCNUC1]